MLENVKIVLIETSHPGNIGATARAMKTMGLSQLTLVKPKLFPDPEASARASGADDVLQQATVCGSLDEALVGCEWVIGTSVRDRELPALLLDSREVGRMVAKRPLSLGAIVFGSERVGLTNEQLHHCHYHVKIPVNPVYGSLNLASAVQIICYEMRMAHMERLEKEQHEYEPLAKNEDMSQFYEHLENVLWQVDFLKKHQSHKSMLRLKRLFNRAQVEQREVNILRGILTAVESTLERGT